MATPMQWAPVEQAEEMEKEGPWFSGSAGRWAGASRQDSGSVHVHSEPRDPPETQGKRVVLAKKDG